jgi:hypothetical protein
MIDLRQDLSSATGTSVPFGRRVRMALYRWHCLIARAETATRLYILVVATMARLLQSCSIRDMVEWANRAECPVEAARLRAQEGRLSDRTEIKLKPHLGEFDQSALFRGQPSYEAPIFAWLERHASDRYDIVVEIGANVGVYSVFFDALIRACQVADCTEFMLSSPPGGRIAVCLRTWRPTMRGP